MSTTYVTAAEACEALSVTPKQLAELAVLRKIRWRRKIGTGIVYDVEEFVARGNSPPEVPVPVRDDKHFIILSRPRVFLAFVVGVGLVPGLLGLFGPRLVSPAAEPAVVVVERLVHGHARAPVKAPAVLVVKKKAPAPKRQEPVVEPPMKLFW